MTGVVSLDVSPTSPAGLLEVVIWLGGIEGGWRPSRVVLNVTHPSTVEAADANAQTVGMQSGHRGWVLS